MAKKDINQKYQDAAERADSGDINKVILEKGENIIRIVDLNFEENYVAYVEDTEGNTRKISMTVDQKENKKKYAALYESISDLKASHRYYFKAIQGKKVETKTGVKTVFDPQVKLFEIGPSIFKQIAAIQMDGEFPDVTEINLKITRKGEKLKTEYTVMPNPKPSPMPELEGELDLLAFVESTDMKTVYDIIGTEAGEDYGENTDDDDETSDIPEDDDIVEDKKPAVTKDKKTSKKKPEPEPEDDEEENEENEEVVAGDEFDDMDRTELKKYIKANGLEISVVKSWSDDVIREKIREQTATDEDTVEDDDDLSDLDDLDED
jgi:hypothetical protein